MGDQGFKMKDEGEVKSSSLNKGDERIESPSIKNSDVGAAEAPSLSKKIVYIILRVLVVLVLVNQIIDKSWNNVFMCILTLILFLIPAFLDRKFHIKLPNTLEIIILLFIFAAQILGEIKEYYIIFEKWDDMLHTMNGFLCAAIGFALIDILNKNERIKFNMTPVFIGTVAFCFSMTVGVLWEFFEFFMDVYTKTDMQKDTIITEISSILFNPEGANQAVTIPIESVVVNGQPWNFGGYIDIGLFDTMNDLWVNCLGAIAFSILGLLYIKGKAIGSFAARFIPKVKILKKNK